MSGDWVPESDAGNVRLTIWFRSTGNGGPHAETGIFSSRAKAEQIFANNPLVIGIQGEGEPEPAGVKGEQRLATEYNQAWYKSCAGMNRRRRSSRRRYVL